MCCSAEIVAVSSYNGKLADAVNEWRSGCAPAPKLMNARSPLPWARAAAGVAATIAAQTARTHDALNTRTPPRCGSGGGGLQRDYSNETTICPSKNPLGGCQNSYRRPPLRSFARVVTQLRVCILDALSVLVPPAATRRNAESNGGNGGSTRSARYRPERESSGAGTAGCVAWSARSSSREIVDDRSASSWYSSSALTSHTS